MLYLAIPAHNEAATIGVLLWRLRTVLAEFPREYEAVVYDDASSDSTSEILENYAKVMPLTVLRGDRQVGYAAAVDALVRHVARDTRYPRRDAMLLLQGDLLTHRRSSRSSSSVSKAEPTLSLASETARSGGKRQPRSNDCFRSNRG